MASPAALPHAGCRDGAASAAPLELRARPTLDPVIREHQHLHKRILGLGALSGGQLAGMHSLSAYLLGHACLLGRPEAPAATIRPLLAAGEAPARPYGLSGSQPGSTLN